MITLDCCCLHVDFHHCFAETISLLLRLRAPAFGMIGAVEAARVCYHAGGRGCLPRDGGCPNVRPYIMTSAYIPVAVHATCRSVRLVTVAHQGLILCRMFCTWLEVVSRPKEYSFVVEKPTARQLVTLRTSCMAVCVASQPFREAEIPSLDSPISESSGSYFPQVSINVARALSKRRLRSFGDLLQVTDTDLIRSGPPAHLLVKCLQKP